MDAYLEITGMEGGCKVNDFLGHFEIMNFSHNASRPEGRASTSADVGHIQHSLFTMTKKLDKASPLLWDMCNSNVKKDIILKLVRIEGAESAAEKGERTIFMTYDMKEVRIINISVSGSTGGEAMETIGFRYKTIEWTYAGADGNTAAGYDISGVDSL